MGDTFRNMPPLAFGIPMNNTIKYRCIIGGLLISYGDYKDSVAIAIRSLKDRFVTIVSLTLVLI